MSIMLSLCPTLALCLMMMLLFIPTVILMLEAWLLPIGQLCTNMPILNKKINVLDGMVRTFLEDGLVSPYIAPEPKSARVKFAPVSEKMRRSRLRQVNIQPFLVSGVVLIILFVIPAARPSRSKRTE